MKANYTINAEQTNIDSLSVKHLCETLKANYTLSDKHLEELLSETSCSVRTTLGGVIQINTSDRKKLATAIVEAVTVYLNGDNSRTATVILSRCERWRAVVNKEPKQHLDSGAYATAVLEKFRKDYGGKRQRGGVFKPLEATLEQWACDMRKQPKPAQIEPKRAEIVKPKGKPIATAFTVTMNKQQVQRLYDQLKEKKYIDGERSDFTSICGIKKDQAANRIKWLAGENELVYFVYRCFYEENKKAIWAVTARCFTLNGTDINPKTLRQLNSQTKIAQEKKDKIDAILKIVEDSEKVKQLTNN